MADLGTIKAAELEVSAPTETAAAAAAASTFGGRSGGGGETSCSSGQRVGGATSGARSGVMSGLEVLWECVLDDPRGNSR